MNLSGLIKTLSMAFLITCPGQAADTTAPPEVIQSAISAVNEMGRQVVMGKHEVAVEKMFPRWKAQMAKRVGGEEKLREQLHSIGDQMVRKGISIISVRTQGAPTVYEVKASVDADGKEYYRRWLLLIPTVTQLRIIEQGQASPTRLNVHGFQVAVADKTNLNWSFINGSDVSVSDLRSLFPALPANMKLPEVKHEVVK